VAGLRADVGLDELQELSQTNLNQLARSSDRDPRSAEGLVADQIAQVDTGVES
jgi:hypothetical protein